MTESLSLVPVAFRVSSAFIVPRAQARHQILMSTLRIRGFRAEHEEKKTEVRAFVFFFFSSPPGKKHQKTSGSTAAFNVPPTLYARVRLASSSSQHPTTHLMGLRDDMAWERREAQKE